MRGNNPPHLPIYTAKEKGQAPQNRESVLYFSYQSACDIGRYALFAS